MSNPKCFYMNRALSPQCGFASVAEGNLLSPDDQWRKLELLVDTARRVWGEGRVAPIGLTA